MLVSVLMAADRPHATNLLTFMLADVALGRSAVCFGGRQLTQRGLASTIASTFHAPRAPGKLSMAVVLAIGWQKVRRERC